MGAVIIILGLLQIAGGLIAYADAESAIHQILGAISFGMGILSLALGTALNHLQAIRKASKAQQTILEDRLGTKS
jgi:hypothetical protein